MKNLSIRWRYLVFAMVTYLVGHAQITANFNQGAQNHSYPISGNINGIQTWSDPNTWDLNRVPEVGDEVIIPDGSTVVVDTEIEVENIKVHGQLVVDPSLSNLTIELKSIEVSGQHALLEIGTSQNPHNGQVVITLVGTDPYPNSSPMLAKGIVAMSGGTIHIHGELKESWTVLSQTANCTDNSIEVEGTSLNWKVGDEIAIATSMFYDFDVHDFWGDAAHLDGTEMRSIDAISVGATTTTITLDAPLDHHHFGQVQTYSGAGQSWTVDERAEVGLLSRNIVIQGDQSSTTSHYGGHIMVMNNSYSYISNVELTRMGQENHLARYPFHWHYAQDVSGQYFNNNSIHHCYFRAVTVHSTWNSTVNDNVVFETQGHAMFFEDGVEINNVMNGNLVMNVRRPPLGIGVNSFIGSDRGEHHIRLRGPSAFWITHPNNDFSGNHAAGIQGVAFWYGMNNQPNPGAPAPPDASGSFPSSYDARNKPFGTFMNNTAHAAMTGFHQDHANDDASASGVTGSIYTYGQWQTISNFTAYHCYRGWWTRTMGGNNPGLTFNNTILTDCPGQGMTVSSFRGRTTNSLFVGETANNYYLPNDFRTTALDFYDGFVYAEDCHFENFLGSKSVVNSIGGRDKRSNNVMKGCTFTDVQFHEPAFFRPGSVLYQSALHDVDGTITGQPWGTITQNHPFIYDDVNFVNHVNNETYITDENVATLQVYREYLNYFQGGANSNPNAGKQYVEWEDGHCIHSGEGEQEDKTQYPVVPNLGRIYKFRMLDGIYDELSFVMDDAENGDALNIQILDCGAPLSVSTNQCPLNLLPAGCMNAASFSLKSTEADVWNSSTNAWYYNSLTNTLSIRMVASGGSTSSVENRLQASARAYVTTGGGSVQTLPRESRPFGGYPRMENELVEAEWYDYGGQGVAYRVDLPTYIGEYFLHRPYAGNKDNQIELGRARRGEILRMLDMGSGELSINDLREEEYIEYTFEGTGEPFHFMIHYATIDDCGLMVYVDGVPAWSRNEPLPSTGGSTIFRTEVLQQVAIPPGTHVVRVESYCPSMAIDWFSVGDPHPVPPPAPLLKTTSANNAPDPVLEVAITPNPTQGMLNVSITDSEDEVHTIILSDMNGRVLEEVETSNASQPFDMSLYPNGVYFVKVIGQEVVRTESFVLQH